MSKTNASKDEIVADLRDKMAQLLSISASSIEKDKPIWNHFPPNQGRKQAPEVTSFCLYVSSEFKVYLTEREWEAPTLEKLAAHIVEKQSNPQHMVAQIRKDQADRKKGLKMALIGCPVVFGALGVLMYFTSPNPDAVALKMVVLTGVMEGLFLLIWFKDTAKFTQETAPVLDFYDNKAGMKS